MNYPLIISDRYGLELPNDYLQLQGKGFLNIYNSKSLKFCEIDKWFSPQEIAEFDSVVYWERQFAPFARTQRRDHWCWVPQWVTHDGTAVALCIRSYSVAEGYAPSFRGALYRMILEEFAGTLLLQNEVDRVERVRRILDGNVKIVAEILPPQWTQVLNGIIGRPGIDAEEDLMRFISSEEINSIIDRDLAFEWLRAEIEYIS